MKVISMTIALLLTATALFARNIQDTTIECIAKWKKGDKKSFLITHLKQKTENGQNPSPTIFEYIAHVSIIDSSTDGYTVKWVYSLTEEFKEATPGIENILKIYNGLEHIVKTTEKGAFKELVNWEEIRDAYVGMMELSLPKKMNDTVRNVIEKTKAMFGTREIVESALIKNIRLFYELFEGSYSTTKISGKVSFPNPFGGDPIPAVASVQLDAFYKSADSYKIITNQEIDSKGLSNMIESMFNQLDVPGNKLSPAEMKELLIGLQIKDYAEYKIYHTNGWIASILHERLAVMQNIKQIERYTITAR